MTNGFRGLKMYQMGANLYIFIKVPNSICIHTKLEMGPAHQARRNFKWASKIIKCSRRNIVKTGISKGGGPNCFILVQSNKIFYECSTLKRRIHAAILLCLLPPFNQHFISNILFTLPFFSNKLSTHTHTQKRILKIFTTQLSGSSSATVKVIIRVYSC